MAKDDEYIMSSFKEFISTRLSFVTYYEMNEEQIDTFNNNICSLKRNPNPNDFPDFIGEFMDVEIFNVTSSKETNSGSKFSIEKSSLRNRMKNAIKLPDDPVEKRKGKSYSETLKYDNHSYEFWISSLRRNIKNHKCSRLNYSPNGKEIVFLAHYPQTVLSYKDEQGIEQWHKLGVDRIALHLISDELNGLIDYFVLFNETNSTAEVIPINHIASYLKTHTTQSYFYPREGAGMIYIGVSETF